MNQLTEQSKIPEGAIFPKRCPVCGVEGNYTYKIEDTREGKNPVPTTWYRCQCGVIHQKDLPSHSVYDASYLDFYNNAKEGKEHSIHAAKCYAPMIEELTYGRMMLDVGYGIPNNMKFMEDRGWLTWGIDVNEDINPGGNLYKGNFETYDFDMQLPPEMKEQLGKDKLKRTFDLIWMSHVFEHFTNPVGVLHKAYDLLSETGVLYISTPDIDFINKTGVAAWSHWSRDEHNILWSEQALKREVERAGFKVIMSRRNFSSRFISWYDVHMVCQKNYF